MKTKNAYVIQCQCQPRCGSGQVLLRMSHAKAVVAARTHAKRRKHVTKVFPVRLHTTYVARPEVNENYVIPAPREMDYEPDAAY